MGGTGLSVWAAGWDSGCEHVWRVGRAVSGLKVCVAGHMGECGAGQFAETGCEVSVSAVSVPRGGGRGRLEENRCSGHHHRLLRAAPHGTAGQTESPDVLRGWLGGVWLSRLHVCLPVCCPHFTAALQISEDPHTTQITLQNQPLGRPREEGPLQPSCPSPLLGLVGLPLSPCPPR